MFINKTVRFLAPCLYVLGSEFVEAFNFVSIVGVFTKDLLDKDRKHVLYIVCNVNDHNNLNYKALKDITIEKGIYIKDYPITKNFFNIRQKVLVIELPKQFHSSWDEFHKSRYSKMYAGMQINKFFNEKDKRSRNDLDILLKNKRAESLFIKRVNSIFNTNIDKFETDIDTEYEFKIDRSETIEYEFQRGKS